VRHFFIELLSLSCLRPRFRIGLKALRTPPD
jgi:hypothetical protein